MHTSSLGMAHVNELSVRCRANSAAQNTEACVVQMDSFRDGHTSSNSIACGGESCACKDLGALKLMDTLTCPPTNVPFGLSHCHQVVHCGALDIESGAGEARDTARKSWGKFCGPQDNFPTEFGTDSLSEPVTMCISQGSNSERDSGLHASEVWTVGYGQSDGLLFKRLNSGFAVCSNKVFEQCLNVETNTLGTPRHPSG